MPRIVCVKAAIPQHPTIVSLTKNSVLEHVLCVVMCAPVSLALVDRVRLVIVGRVQCVLESVDSLMLHPFFHESLAYSLFAMFVAPTSGHDQVSAQRLHATQHATRVDRRGGRRLCPDVGEVTVSCYVTQS